MNTQLLIQIVGTAIMVCTVSAIFLLLRRDPNWQGKAAIWGLVAVIAAFVGTQAAQCQHKQLISNNPNMMTAEEYKIYKAEYLRSYDRDEALKKVLEYKATGERTP